MLCLILIGTHPIGGIIPHGWAGTILIMAGGIRGIITGMDIIPGMQTGITDPGIIDISNIIMADTGHIMMGITEAVINGRLKNSPLANGSPLGLPGFGQVPGVVWPRAGVKESRFHAVMTEPGFPQPGQEHGFRMRMGQGAPL